MGPLPFSSGNGNIAWSAGSVYLRFNGAAAFQQRKYENLLPHLVRWEQASMGPLPFSSGNNSGKGIHEGSGIASMGPLPFSSGNWEPVD